MNLLPNVYAPTEVSVVGGGAITADHWNDSDGEFPKTAFKARARVEWLKRNLRTSKTAEERAANQKLLTAAIEHYQTIENGPAATIHTAHSHAQTHAAVGTRANDRATRIAAIKVAIAAQTPVLIIQGCNIRNRVSDNDTFIKLWCDGITAAREYELCRLDNYDDLHPMDRAEELKRELAGSISTERRKEIAALLAHLTSSNHSHLAQSSRAEVARLWAEVARKIGVLATAVKFLMEQHLEERKQKEADFFFEFGVPAHPTAATTVFEPLLREIEQHINPEEQRMLNSVQPSAQNLPLLHFFNARDII